MDIKVHAPTTQLSVQGLRDLKAESTLPKISLLVGILHLLSEIGPHQAASPLEAAYLSILYLLGMRFVTV